MNWALFLDLETELGDYQGEPKKPREDFLVNTCKRCRSAVCVQRQLQKEISEALKKVPTNRTPLRPITILEAQ